uniref:Orc2 n=1 Tax=Arundo donax TaxID=35708 RepID=A0A0A9DBA0_ARUDO
MTLKSVKVVEAKSSSNCFLDPNPYINKPKPHLISNSQFRYWSL